MFFRLRHWSPDTKAHAKAVAFPAAIFILGWLLVQSSVPTAHAASTVLHDPGVRITMTGARLSLTTIATPWPVLLEEFQRRTGVALHVVPPPLGAVTVSIENLHIETVLRLLFGTDAGFVYVYRPGSAGAPAVLDEVVVTLGRSTGSASVPNSPPSPGTRANQSPVTPMGRGGDEGTLQAEDPELRLQALDAVVERGDGSGVGEIQHVLATDADLEVRTRAARALARVATPEALEALRQGLDDPETTVRLSAVEAIASFETPRARSLLRDALRDRDEQVREVAAAAIQSMRRAGL